MNEEASVCSVEGVGDKLAFQAYLKNELMANIRNAKEDTNSPSIDEKVAEVEVPSLIIENPSISESNSWEISDENYFKALASKQLALLEENSPDITTMENKSIHCTACNKLMYPKLGNIVRHPLLGVAFCRNCKHFYGNGIGWDQDEDGSDKYCRWCGRGGEVMVCDNCLKGFCAKCLQRNLGRRKMTEIKQSDEWNCVDCFDQDILKYKCEYYAVYKYNIQKLHESSNKTNATSARKNHSFIDKVIDDSFQAIKKYQNMLEEQHKSLLQLNKPLDSESAAQYTKSLRKLHKDFRKKTHMIDHSIIKSYTAVFPDDISKIQDRVNKKKKANGKVVSQSRAAKKNVSKNKTVSKAKLKIKVQKIKVNRSKSEMPDKPKVVAKNKIKVEKIKVNRIKSEMPDKPKVVAKKNVTDLGMRNKRKRNENATMIKEKQDAAIIPWKKRGRIPKIQPSTYEAKSLPIQEETAIENHSGSDSEIDIEN